MKQLKYIINYYVNMDSIDEFFNIEVKIDNQKLIIEFVATGNSITELRKLMFLKKFEEILNQMNNDKIETFYFVFILNKGKMPTNFSFMNDVSNIFLKYQPILLKKLDFSVIQYKSNMVYTFFRVLKKFYSPIRPLYLCQNSEDVTNCIHDSEKRKKIPDLTAKIKKNQL